MKKIKYLLITALLIPINVKALSGSVSVNCTPTTANPGSIITCTINGSSDDVVKEIEVPYNISNGGVFESFDYNTSIWAYADENANKIESVPKENLNGSFNIGTIKFKIVETAPNGTVTLSLNNIVFYDKNDSEVNIPGTSASITVTSDTPTPTAPPTATPTTPPAVEKGLKELRCTSGGTLSPQLTDNNTGYAIILSSPETNSFAISAKAKNSSDEVVFKNADTGETLDSSNINFTTSGGKDTMLIKLYVGSGDNEVTYTIAVSKPVSERGALASLVVGGKSITLIEGKYDYQVALDNVDSYQIQATVKDSSKFEVDTSNIFRMLNGENSYEITVRPKDNTSGYESSIYIVTVTKNGTKTPTPTVKPAPPSSNPQTGSGGVIAIGLILAISLGATIYMYKRNTLNSDTN